MLFVIYSSLFYLFVSTFMFGWLYPEHIPSIFDYHEEMFSRFNEIWFIAIIHSDNALYRQALSKFYLGLKLIEIYLLINDNP